MSFCTAINCMDGRVQLPVIHYLMKRFDADFVDTVTEPGPNKILADGTDSAALQSIHARVRISVEHHGSRGIAIVGHHDCAGNPAGRQEQEKHTRTAVQHIRRAFQNIPVIGLWVDEAWKVSEIDMTAAQ